MAEAKLNEDLETEERMDASERSRVPRLISAFATAAVTAYWIGPWALAWLCVYLAVETVFNPWYLRTRIMPYLQSDPGRADRAAAFIIGFGSCVFVAGWAPAWFVGGAQASFMAGLYFGSAMLHSVIYFGRDRLSFLACVLPPGICAAIMPFFAATHPVIALVTLVTLAQIAASVWQSRRDRNSIVRHIGKIQSKVEAANNASLAKSQFLATMSHELRTPLNAIIGYAEILEEDLAADSLAVHAQDAGRIRRSARDLLLLINEILDFSKIEAGRMDVHLAPTDISAIVADVVETTAHLATAHRNKVIVELDGEMGEVVTDGQRLRQCLLNLVSNACKFTDDGEVRIRVGFETDHGHQHLVVEVRDTGCGLSEEDARRVFKPFVQADGTLTRSKGGTGLGLVITKRLAELLGGDVSFVSAPNQGSTFTLRIRAHKVETAPAALIEGPSVLVVEDEASARDLFRRALGRLPLAIVETKTAQEGFDRAKEITPALIVLDIYLPDRSGWSLLAEFKAHPTLQHVPVLIVSTDDDRQRAMRLGACEHFTKPVDRERLAAAVIRFALADAPRTPAAAPRAQENAA